MSAFVEKLSHPLKPGRVPGSLTLGREWWRPLHPCMGHLFPGQSLPCTQLVIQPGSS
jgi:hypothetical protein